MPQSNSCYELTIVDLKPIGVCSRSDILKMSVVVSAADLHLRTQEALDLMLDKNTGY